MLKELKAQHRKIAKMSYDGYKPAEIAQETHMSVSTVRSVLSDPMCKAHIKALADKADNLSVQVQKKLSELALPAVATLKDLLTFDDVPANVQLQAARDVLDRTGHQPPTQNLHLHGFFTAEDMADLKQRAAEMRRSRQEEPVAIEAEYQTVTEH